MGLLTSRLRSASVSLAPVGTHAAVADPAFLLNQRFFAELCVPWGRLELEACSELDSPRAESSGRARLSLREKETATNRHVSKALLLFQKHIKGTSKKKLSSSWELQCLQSHEWTVAYFATNNVFLSPSNGSRQLGLAIVPFGKWWFGAVGSSQPFRKYPLPIASSQRGTFWTELVLLSSCCLEYVLFFFPSG